VAKRGTVGQPVVTAAEGRRSEITTTAARLFNEFGVDRVSMDDVAKAVGLAKPTLYHYFPSKEQILYTIHKDLFEVILSALEERLATGAPPDEQLLGVFLDMFESMDTHPGHTRVFFEHFRKLGAEYRAAVRKEQRRYERLVQGIVEDGIAQGYFRAVDPRLASLALFGMANWSHQWYSPKGRHRPRQLAEQFYDFFVQGIGAGPPAANGRRKRR
jgi:AcrR family transcriptional regulator